MNTLLIVIYALAALSASLAAVAHAINGNWILTTIWSLVAVAWVALMIIMNRLEQDR